MRGAGGGALPARSSQHDPEDAFLPLSKRCFNLFDEGYEYEVCPFHSASQIDRGSKLSLGARFAWQAAPGQHEHEHEHEGGPVTYRSRMILHGGATCPSGVARSVHVLFQCAESNKLLHVTEPQSCEYHMTLATPAAC